MPPLSSGALQGCARLAALIGAVLLALLTLAGLERPLFWADEAETAMFAERVREHGYPKVHSGGNVVYQFGPDIAAGIDESSDAYIGTTWGHFYFALPGLLWAEATRDPRQRTFRMRLPFALAGLAGIAAWIAALRPAVGGGPLRRLVFTASFLLASAVSISLLLHLREVRYYALTILIGGLLARCQFRYAVYRSLSFRGYACQLPVLLLLLFHVFHPAFFTAGCLLCIDGLWRLRSGTAPRRDLVPLAAAALLVLPFAHYFELGRASARQAGGALTLAAYAEHLSCVLEHFLRHEFLAPALLCRAWLVASGRREARAAAVSGRLAVFALGHALVLSASPLVFERYFVLLSPVVTGWFLLDAQSLLAAPGRIPRSRRALGLVLAVLLLRVPGIPALAGRVQEIATPVAGPLDPAIDYLLQAVPQSSELVIATNYEEHVLMYYLGCRVVIGLSLSNLLEDRRAEPDIVIPRRRWPRSLREVQPFLARGEWEEVRFPLQDLHTNTTPALSRWPSLPATHRFASAVTGDPEQQLRLYRRLASTKRTGTSIRP